MNTEKLTALQQKMQELYSLFQLGTITEGEYLLKIKPIDQAIDNIEMSTLLEGYPVLKRSFSSLSHKLES